MRTSHGLDRAVFLLQTLQPAFHQWLLRRKELWGRRYAWKIKGWTWKKIPFLACSPPRKTLTLAQRLGGITESISCCYTSAPSSKQCVWMVEQEQDQGQRPCIESIGSGLRDPLQLWAKVHWGNKEGTETRILDRASHTTTLLIKETMYTSLRDQAELLNRDQGLDIDCCSKNLTRRPPKRQQNREQSRG